MGWTCETHKFCWEAIPGNEVKGDTYGHDYRATECPHCRIAELEKENAALKAEREWVPVSEGLPESKGFDDGTIYVWVSDGDAHIGGICELAAWHEYWPVEKYIALPPLPAPPDTEGEQ